MRQAGSADRFNDLTRRQASDLVVFVCVAGSGDGRDKRKSLCLGMQQSRRDGLEVLTSLIAVAGHAGAHHRCMTACGLPRVTLTVHVSNGHGVGRGIPFVVPDPTWRAALEVVERRAWGEVGG